MARSHAIYAFGSRITGDNNADSDLDLAILLPGYSDPLALRQQTGAIADITHYPVDLLDMSAASTIMQHQILTTGEHWWHRNREAGPSAMLSEKLHMGSSSR